jgi:hypothetical protein
LPAPAAADCLGALPSVAGIALILAQSLLNLIFDVSFRIMKTRKTFEPRTPLPVAEGWIYRWVLLVSLLLAGGEFSAKAQSSLNVADFGAAGDAVQFYVNTVSNSPVVTTTNQLSSADIGKTIEVWGVGYQVAGVNSYGVNVTNYLDITATITGVVNGTNIFISVTPQQTLTNTFATYGTDNRPAFAKCIAAAGTNCVINIPNGTFLFNPIWQAYGYCSIVINRGGLHFLGSGNTRLLSRGAFVETNFPPYGLHGIRGIFIELVAPVTNDYPLIFDNLTLDGGVTNGNLNVHGEYVNEVDGLGWDVQHTAYLTTDSGAQTGTATHQVFTNVTVQHWRGEMLKSIDQNTNGNVDIENCFFGDGCATALNIYPSWNVRNNTFSNLFQVAELYQAYYTNTAYYCNNFVTNIAANGFALNGGFWGCAPFVMQSNVFYFSGVGYNGIETTPAANVSILNNEIHCAPYMSAIAIGVTGSQGTQCNSNILIAGNNVYCAGKLGCFAGWGGPGIYAVHGITVCSNTVSATEMGSLFNSQCYADHVSLYNNKFSSPIDSFGLFTNGDQTFPLIQSNNLYQPRRLYSYSVATNMVCYTMGPKQYLDNVKGSNLYVLNDSEAARIPAGAYFEFDNRTNLWPVNNAGSSGDVLIQPSQSSPAQILLPYGQEIFFYWNGSAWTTNAPATTQGNSGGGGSTATNTPTAPAPPTNFRVLN